MYPGILVTCEYDPDRMNSPHFDTRSLANDIRERDILTRTQIQLFRKKWNALFDTLDYSIDPQTGFDEGYDAEGMRTYASNTQVFEGQKYFLDNVTAYLCQNRQHSIIVQMNYRIDAPERAYRDCEVHTCKERSYDFKPLLNYHYSASCKFDYIKSGDGVVCEVGLRYTVIPTPKQN